MISINNTCIVCEYSSEIYGRYECSVVGGHTHLCNAASTTCSRHTYKKIILCAETKTTQDEYKCSVCGKSFGDDGYSASVHGARHQHSIDVVLGSSRKPIQDPATKCTDPADKDAVIRDLRIEKNGLLCIINSIRGDAEAAHGKIEGALEHRDSERLREARDATQNIIESIGVKP
ncbi:MAG: hypothetical protein KAJ03_09475 [Gammaproteobacteria bacterium]|nr:hypothetical protein [Gammaproteobacteria bacterium]